MASALQKLLRRSLLTRAIFTLQSPVPPQQFPALHILDPRNAPACTFEQFLGRQATDSPAPTLPCPIFPSFPRGVYEGPMYVGLPAESEVDDVESGESDGTLWADSVKKKRKKKMNKHKYKKLRKRLRRQT